MTIERRRFIATAAGVVASTATVAGVTVDAPGVIAQPKVQWRMSTAWTPALDADQGVTLERGVIDAAEWVGSYDDMKRGFRRSWDRGTTSPRVPITSWSACEVRR